MWLFSCSWKNIKIWFRIFCVSSRSSCSLATGDSSFIFDWIVTHLIYSSLQATERIMLSFVLAIYWSLNGKQRYPGSLWWLQRKHLIICIHQLIIFIFTLQCSWYSSWKYQEVCFLKSKYCNIFYKHNVSSHIKLHFIGNFTGLISISQKSEVLKFVEK